MKKLTTIVVWGIILPLIMAFAAFKPKKSVELIKLQSKPIANIKVTPTIEPIKIDLKDHSTFLDALGHFESSNRYDIVNRFGYMGRYQFGKSTLKSIGIKVSRNEFLNNPSLQEEAMDRLLTQNYKSLKRYINKYEGKYVHGILITKSGVLAAAHLAGSGNVRKFFRKGYEFKDGNGTKMTTYMKLFGGYELNI